MQNKPQNVDFATDQDNLALTDRSINQSTRDFDKDSWKNKETEKGLKNKDRFNIDDNMLNEQIKKGKEVKKRHLPTSIEKTQYYGKNSGITEVNEGTKMGIQQAIGLVMTEFFDATFDEIIDIYKNGFSSGFDNEKFFTILNVRLEKIATRIKLKWRKTSREAAIAFKDGFISGFISNLVTTVINMFKTTGKRIIKIIREGIFSLFKAIKMLLFPPENMSFEDTMHEVKKLLATGVIVSLGVIVEEHISHLLKMSVFLTPFEEILTAIFVGALTGLAITITVYYIDKKRNDKNAIKEMIDQTNAKLDNLLEALFTGVQPQMLLIK
jgi:hypothetical protein